MLSHNLSFYSNPFSLPVISYKTGWSGDAMVLGKLPVPRRPTNLD